MWRDLIAGEILVPNEEHRQAVVDVRCDYEERYFHHWIAQNAEMTVRIELLIAKVRSAGCHQLSLPVITKSDMNDGSACRGTKATHPKQKEQRSRSW